MTKKILIATTLLAVVVGLTLFAGSPFSGSWSGKIVINPDPFSFAELSSIIAVNYAVGGFVAASNSEFVLTGFIWQGFGVTGTLGAFNAQGDLLFGASTADFIYDQVIVTTSIAGIDFGFYFAQLSDKVLGGAADGFAVRLAGSVGVFDIVSIMEIGAQIEDEDDDNFNGITIYHASTGLYKHYVTNPIVVGQGFTGEKLTVSGWSFGCVEDIATTLYMTCGGFDFIRFDLTGIDVGLPWLTFDVDLTFQLQIKSIVLTPTLVLGEAACIDVYAAILTDAQDNTIYGGFASLTGISLYGLGFSYSWDGVTVTDLTVLDTSCYAITTPEYGSAIEEITEALKNGHEFYPDYWELISIEVVGDGCCGGSSTFLANTYFNKNETALFGWGMTHIEATIPINSVIFLSGQVEVDTSGLDHIGFGFEVGW